MKIVILDSACCGRGKLEAATRQALGKIGIEAEIETVTDLSTILGYGVMATPALVVDGQIRVAGRVPSVDDLASLISRSAS
ncbi:MAG: thioredoxin family protein [Coriobacteriia bacterium]|nr:thioredoxin family protein [Coriobacteriia bacterium]